MTGIRRQMVDRNERPEETDRDELLHLQPALDLEEELESLYEEGDYDLSEDAEPIDRGNHVGSTPFGWFRCLPSEGDERCPWQLLPLGFQTAALSIVGVGAWQSMSMTGAVLSGGAKASEAWALIWSRGDEGLEFMEIRRRFDQADLAVEITQAVLGEGDPLCPQVDEHGWEIDLTFSPTIPTETVEACLDIAWRPCGEDPRHEYVFVADRWYGWTGMRWALQGRPPGAQLIGLHSSDESDETIAATISAAHEGLLNTKNAISGEPRKGGNR